MNYAVLLAELKRRKVLRVAAVYGATSFVILQVADVVFPSLGLPAEGAIANLQRGLAAGEPRLIVIGTDRIYDPLRGDARFIRITEQLGIPNGVQ